jgi:hypothetical protein
VPIVQTAVAAGLAWVVARDVVGHESPFFAPIAAIIALGVGQGRRIRRAAEMALGVAVGITIGDLLIGIIGQGAAQIALLVILAMSVVVLLGGSTMVIGQAATSVALVATVPGGGGVTRLVDALVGGAVGLAVLAIVPENPVREARRAADALVAEVAATQDDIADALARRDGEGAEAALARARALDELAAQLARTVETMAETALLAPTRWRSREDLDRYAGATLQLELALRGTRVLARAALRCVELDPVVPAELSRAVAELGAAVRAVGEALGGGDDAVARERALHAVELATDAAGARASLSVSAVVAQVRSIATDLLAAIGTPRDEAVSLVRAVAEEPTPGPRARA